MRDYGEQMELNKKCPHCGGNAKIHTRQMRFLRGNFAEDKLIRMGAQAVCQKCKARGPLVTADVINPYQRPNVRMQQIVEKAERLWNERK